MAQFKCKECDWIGPWDELKVNPKPSPIEDDVVFEVCCPNCGSESIEEATEEWIISRS